MGLSVKALAEEYVTFTKTFKYPKSGVVAFALQTGWQEKISETVQQEHEVVTTGTRFVDSGNDYENGSPIMVSESYDVVTTVTDNVIVEVDNPVTAAEWADSKTGAAIVEYLSQFSVDAIIAQKEVEKQAAAQAIRAAVGAGVTTTITEE